MSGEKVLDTLLPEAGDVGPLRLLSWLETTAMKMDSVRPDALRRLAALLDTDAAGAAAVAQRLHLSNRQTGRLAAIAVPSFTIGVDLDAPARRRLMQHHGAETVRDVALLAWATARAMAPRGAAARSKVWQTLLDEAEAWTPKALPIDGDDVLALGIAPGPRVGDLLDAVAAWWADGDFTADREACLETLRRQAAAEDGDAAS
jgi:poly(A) polymerase